MKRYEIEAINDEFKATLKEISIGNTTESGRAKRLGDSYYKELLKYYATILAAMNNRLIQLNGMLAKDKNNDILWAEKEKLFKDRKELIEANEKAIEESGKIRSMVDYYVSKAKVNANVEGSTAKIIEHVKTAIPEYEKDPDVVDYDPEFDYNTVRRLVAFYRKTRDIPEDFNKNSLYWNAIKTFLTEEYQYREDDNYDISDVEEVEFEKLDDDAKLNVGSFHQDYGGVGGKFSMPSRARIVVLAREFNIPLKASKGINRKLASARHDKSNRVVISSHMNMVFSCIIMAIKYLKLNLLSIDQVRIIRDTIDTDIVHLFDLFIKYQPYMSGNLMLQDDPRFLVLAALQRGNITDYMDRINILSDAKPSDRDSTMIGGIYTTLQTKTKFIPYKFSSVSMADVVNRYYANGILDTREVSNITGYYDFTGKSDADDTSMSDLKLTKGTTSKLNLGKSESFPSVYLALESIAIPGAIKQKLALPAGKRKRLTNIVSDSKAKSGQAAAAYSRLARTAEEKRRLGDQYINVDHTRSPWCFIMVPITSSVVGRNVPSPVSLMGPLRKDQALKLMGRMFGTSGMRKSFKATLTKKEDLERALDLLEAATDSRDITSKIHELRDMIQSGEFMFSVEVVDKDGNVKMTEKVVTTRDEDGNKKQELEMVPVMTKSPEVLYIEDLMSKFFGTRIVTIDMRKFIAAASEDNLEELGDAMYSTQAGITINDLGLSVMGIINSVLYYMPNFVVVGYSKRPEDWGGDEYFLPETPVSIGLNLYDAAKQYHELRSRGFTAGIYYVAMIDTNDTRKSRLDSLPADTVYGDDGKPVATLTRTIKFSPAKFIKAYNSADAEEDAKYQLVIKGIYPRATKDFIPVADFGEYLGQSFFDTEFMDHFLNEAENTAEGYDDDSGGFEFRNNPLTRAIRVEDSKLFYLWLLEVYDILTKDAKISSAEVEDIARKVTLQQFYTEALINPDLTLNDAGMQMNKSVVMTDWAKSRITSLVVLNKLKQRIKDGAMGQPRENPKGFPLTGQTTSGARSAKFINSTGEGLQPNEEVKMYRPKVAIGGKTVRPRVYLKVDKGITLADSDDVRDRIRQSIKNKGFINTTTKMYEHIPVNNITGDVQLTTKYLKDGKGAEEVIPRRRAARGVGPRGKDYFTAATKEATQLAKKKAVVDESPTLVPLNVSAFDIPVVSNPDDVYNLGKIMLQIIVHYMKPMLRTGKSATKSNLVELVNTVLEKTVEYYAVFMNRPYSEDGNAVYADLEAAVRHIREFIAPFLYDKIEYVKAGDIETFPNEDIISYLLNDKAALSKLLRPDTSYNSLISSVPADIRMRMVDRVVAAIADKLEKM